MSHNRLLQFIYSGVKTTLLNALKNGHLKEYSAKAIKRAIDQKAAKINGKQILRASEVLNSGDQVVFDLLRLAEPEKIEILFQDESILIINKPAFIISSDLEIQKRLKTKAKLCHRLDKETSGILVLAQNSAALNEIETLFYKQEVKKRYLCIVKSFKILPEKFKVNQPIGILKKTAHQIVMKIDPKGASSETYFKVIKANHPHYLLECFPKTGRTHQIRLHLASIGAPILGDLVYGKTGSESGRFLLHAESIQFKHPLSKKEVTYSAKIPLDFQSAVDKLFPL